MIFLTVGTQFPFDRLVRAIDSLLDNGLIDDEIFAQIGESSHMPRNFEWVKFLEKKAFDKRFREASGIISHAGIGVITMALDNNKPLLVMPRLKRYGEVVNDHQVAIACRFSELGHILAAYDIKDLPGSIRRLKNFIHRRRKPNTHAITNRIYRFLESLNKSGPS